MPNDVLMRLLFLLLCITGAVYLTHARAAEQIPATGETPSLMRAYVIDWNWLQVVADIPKGRELRKQDLSFRLAAPGLALERPHYPPGDHGVYRGKTTVNLPLRYHVKRSDAARPVDLTVSYTLCTAGGGCQPRVDKAFRLTIPAPLNLADGGGETHKGFFGALSRIANKLGIGDAAPRRFLKPDEAFVLSTQAPNGRTIMARWHIADGYYLYRKKFRFAVKQGGGITLGQPRFPPGKEKVDDTFGRSEVYYKQVAALIPVRGGHGQPTHVVLVAHYQGCADAGFCYPPITKTVDIDLPAGTAGTTTDGVRSGPPPLLSETDRIARSLAADNLAVTLVSFFGIGLLLAFTPCVFPMLPILSGIIVGQGSDITARRAFTLSLVYVLPMAVTYTAAGMIAGLVGKNLQASFQAPWIIAAFSAVFVLLALSMFGLYDLQLPSRWQTKLAELSHRQRRGTLIGVAVMGLFSALIVGPCVAAPLAGTLLYIGQSHNALVGGSALFSMSLGMGVPLLAFGTSAGKLLPKAGPWMEGIKALFGVLLLGVAIWFLGRILPDAATMSLWAGLLVISAVYLGAFTKLPVQAGGWLKLRKGAGLLAMLYGLIVLVGAAAGGTDVLQPLQGLAAVRNGLPMDSRSGAMHFVPVKGPAGLMHELAQAHSQGKPVMLDFYADWCVDCKKMERSTFADPKVKALLSRYVVLQSDVTAYDRQDQALLQEFGLPGPPAVLFFGQNGHELRRLRLIGFTDPDDFIQQLHRTAPL